MDAWISPIATGMLTQFQVRCKDPRNPSSNYPIATTDSTGALTGVTWTDLFFSDSQLVCGFKFQTQFASIYKGLYGMSVNFCEICEKTLMFVGEETLFEKVLYIETGDHTFNETRMEIPLLETYFINLDPNFCPIIICSIIKEGEIVDPNANYWVDQSFLYINTDPAEDFFDQFQINCSNSNITATSALVTVNMTYWVPPLPEKPYEVWIEPEFNGSLKNINTTLNFTNEEVKTQFQSEEFQEYTFKIPQIIDINQDFETIQFENARIGSTYWTNTTDAKIERKLKKAEFSTPNSHLSYSFSLRILSVFLKKSEIETFEGDNDIKIHLIDAQQMKKSFLVRLTINLI